MDWPHDPDGEEGSEGRRKYGHAVLAKKVDDDDFPITREWYVEEFGDHPVRLDSERVVAVSEVMDAVEAEEFEDFVAFHRAVGQAMRREGYWFYEGSDAFVRDRA